METPSRAGGCRFWSRASRRRPRRSVPFRVSDTRIVASRRSSSPSPSCLLFARALARLHVPRLPGAGDKKTETAVSFSSSPACLLLSTPLHHSSQALFLVLLEIGEVAHFEPVPEPHVCGDIARQVRRVAPRHAGADGADGGAGSRCERGVVQLEVPRQRARVQVAPGVVLRARANAAVREAQGTGERAPVDVPVRLSRRGVGEGGGGWGKRERRRRAPSERSRAPSRVLVLVAFSSPSSRIASRSSAAALLPGGCGSYQLGHMSAPLRVRVRSVRLLGGSRAGAHSRACALASARRTSRLHDAQTARDGELRRERGGGDARLEGAFEAAVRTGDRGGSAGRVRGARTARRGTVRRGGRGLETAPAEGVQAAPVQGGVLEHVHADAAQEVVGGRGGRRDGEGVGGGSHEPSRGDRLRIILVAL